MVKKCILLAFEKNIHFCLTDISLARTVLFTKKNCNWNYPQKKECHYGVNLLETGEYCSVEVN